jgi:hypothetical protein
VTATMTWVGLDVHARSTHAAAIDRESGELTRARFGAGVEEVVAWLQALPQPIHGCYEAGPTGSALYRATEAAALRVDVVAPSKTPRASADRVKSDRKDAELLVRLLLAGSLSAVAVPPASFEAARDLARAREQVRADLARLRHRVSKLLLRYGRVHGGGTWTQAHRQWLAAQRFEHVPTELAYLDTLAAIDGLLARRAALDERLSLLAAEPEHWPTVARLRCFRGIETLSALVLHLEVGDPDPRRGRLALPARAADRRHPPQPPGRPARPHPPDRLARAAPPLPSPPAPARPRQARQHRRRRHRTRAGLLSLGGSRGRLTPTRSRRGKEGAGAEAAGTRDATMGRPSGRRPFLDRRRPATQKRPGVANPRISDWRSRRAPRRLPHRQPKPLKDWAMPPAA